jgi:magnesium chelatase family protein
VVFWSPPIARYGSLQRIVTALRNGPLSAFFSCDYALTDARFELDAARITPPTWLAAGRRVQYTNCYLHACPCGFFGDATRECRCTPGIIQRYLGKISGPLLDRIDIHIEVPAVPYKELRSNGTSESSSDIRGRVEQARATQLARGFVNARMPVRMIRRQCALDEAGERTLEMAVRRMGLSARAHDRILKVARTIAYLDHSETVSAKHLAEAVQYRSLDRNHWS